MPTETKRRPAHMEMVGGKGSRQRAWEAIRQHAGAFSCYQIARKAKVDDRTLYSYLQCLERGGFLEGHKLPGAPIGTEKTWSLQRDNGVEAPRLNKKGEPVTQGLGNEAIWRSMRIISDFSAAELAAHASASGVVVKVDTVKTYLLLLRLAGYVQVVAESKSKGIGKGKGQARYRLAPGKYTGPRPPMIQRTKSVYDPNLAKVVYQEEAINDDDL
ncbi:hypothetical protein [Undibacterium sp.]|jgi:hypothetical protein|uniref:hypothetical protein n=1 Tax=Undibacterium sp. TaxID=1914977 RepID=UPI002BB5A8AC|nr:hypothetical protein [Undibacterium sp.]HTD05880.1 hypothetical protein [Undibacterium sp.]